MRPMFGGGPEDVVMVVGDDGDLQPGGGATVLFYSTEVGDNPITDLLDINESPVTSVTASTGLDGRAAGQVGPFYGKDETYEMWASANGGPRFLMQASNLGSLLGPIRQQYLQHAAQSNGHGTRLQDLVNVDPTTVGSPAAGQGLVFDDVSGLWKAGTVGSGGGGGSGDVTTNTSQTISGTKTFSGLQTFTGGVVEKPASTTGQARIAQALASQTGNIDEWRDSGGTARAWITSGFAMRAANLVQTITFCKTGSLATGTGTFRWYNDTTVTLTILGVRATVGTASTSGTPTFDVNKNGTTVFGTQANRPTITVGSFTSGLVTGMSVTTVAPGEYLTSDVDVAGTGTADAAVAILVA
jgi:hypothetical protein